MHTTLITLYVGAGGTSEKVATSTISALVPAAVITAAQMPAGQHTLTGVLTLDATGFVRKGAAPTALNTGVDQIILANTPTRVQLKVGEQLAVVLASGTGNAYWTPNA